jgi:predicted  nucleic acid-binding Zn-ribbon protein
MLEAIEKLLILQDRDRKILKVQEELSRIGPDRQSLQAMLAGATGSLDAAKNRVKHLESERKKLELDVEAKKQLIEKYSLQQFQTKKNEEYRALAHEIEMCKEVISKLDDQQIEIMEKAEAEQKAATKAAAEAAEIKKTVESRIADLDRSEAGLKKELAELQSNREELAVVVEEAARSRYERLLKQKGQNAIVGIQHGVCGGCHMQLSRSIIVGCQGEQEIVTCPNCARILYYTRDMDLAVAD